MPRTRAARPASPAAATATRILVVDDSPDTLELIQRNLALQGYAVHTAADGAAALELLAAERCIPEVILVDAQMPGLSGTRLIAKLRSRCKATIVAISASKPSAEVIAAADGFLLKPFSPDSLSKLLEGRKQQAAPSAGESYLDPGQPVVNPETLARLREMMPETAVREIYAAMVADLTLRQSALEAAVAQGDAAEVRRIGHAISGGCSMAGALQTARLGALLEAEGNQLDNNSDLLRDLRSATRNLERMLEAEFPA